MAGKADQVKSTLQKATEKDPTAANSRTLKRGFSPLQCAASAKEFAADCMNVLISAGAELKHQDMVRATNSFASHMPHQRVVLPTVCPGFRTCRRG